MVLWAAVRLIHGSLQVFTIYLAVYKHFMEAIDAIDNGKTQAYTSISRMEKLSIQQQAALDTEDVPARI